MTTIQRFLTKILPRSKAEAMKAESLSWMVKCTCGYEQSVWELGGIRWKAKGNPKQLRLCSKCGQRTWHTFFRKTDTSNT
jgi:hypothetical protein